jgi:hypothetical protein
VENLVLITFNIFCSRYKSSFANLIDFFRRTCECLSNLAKQRHVLEINIFQTHTEAILQHDYSKEIDNFRLLNNLHFTIKTALSEAAMVSKIFVTHFVLLILNPFN